MKLSNIMSAVAIASSVSLYGTGPASADDGKNEFSVVLTSADNGGTVPVAVGTTIAVEFAATPGFLTVWELRTTPPFLTPKGSQAVDDSKDGRLRVQYIFTVDGAGSGPLEFHARLLTKSGQATNSLSENLWRAVINAE